MLQKLMQRAAAKAVPAAAVLPGQTAALQKLVPAHIQIRPESREVFNP